MKNKVFILALLWSLLAYPYTITNTASIKCNELATITYTNTVTTTYWKKGIVRGEIKDVLSGEELSGVDVFLNGSSSVGMGTYSLWKKIYQDNTRATFSASKGGYYEKQRAVSLSSSTTSLDFFLCPEKRAIPGFTWRMVSFPVEPSGNAAISGNTLQTGDDLGNTEQDNWRVYIWDEDAQEDDYLSKYRSPGTITSGLGYWFKYYNPATISLFTQGTPTKATYTIPLKAGWNMVGNPSVFRLNKDSLKVLDGTNTYPLGSYTENAFWGYDGGYNPENTLLPHFGYWIRAISPCSLVFPKMEWDDNEGMGISLFSLSDGYVRLIARSSGITSNLIFGISPNASDGFDFGLDLSSPPKALDSLLYLCFKGGYIRDIRKDRDDITWEVSISSKAPIELSFEGIEGIDKEYQVFLIDGNNIFDLRKEPSYTLNYPRNLKIRFVKEGLIVQENRIVKTITYPNPSQGELTFYIGLRAKEASFNVTIYNIVGQKVYEGSLLPTPGKSWGDRFSKEEQAYIYESKFEGKGSHNLPLASGLYIYEIRSYALNSENKACGKLLIK
ncbi:MAG: hypothetical protein AB1595_00005 [bacterium]